MTDPSERPDRKERRRSFQRYERAVLESGQPYFPYVMAKDVVAGLAALVVVVALAVVWHGQAACGHWWQLHCAHVRTPDQMEHAHPFLGATYEKPVDPAQVHYDPRPDWYFLWLFELFRIFRIPALAIVPTILVPAAAVLALLAVPFVDRTRERHPKRRPRAVAGVVIVGVLLFTLTEMGHYANHERGDLPGRTPQAASSAALPGWDIVQHARCLDCHVVGTDGQQGLKAPDLSDESSRNRGLFWQIEHLNDPRSRVAGSRMPRLGGSDLTLEQRTLVGEWLESLGDPSTARHYAEHGESSRYPDGKAPLTKLQASGYYRGSQDK